MYLRGRRRRHLCWTAITWLRRRRGSPGQTGSQPKAPPAPSACCCGHSWLGWHGVHFGSVAASCAWGINAVLFPGLVVIYELSLLIRGEHHPVAIRQVKLPAALLAAVVLWILIQNATWTPDWMHHPIWQMTADALAIANLRARRSCDLSRRQAPL